MIRASPLRRRIPSTSLSSIIRPSPLPRFSPLHCSQGARRLASSTSGPAAKSSWKSFFVRLGLAGGAVYYYNTNPIFGNEPALPPLHAQPQPRAPPTLDSLAPKRSRQSPSTPSMEAAIPSDIPIEDLSSAAPPAGGDSGDPAALEAEAAQQGAFNEETGEINWDCPCLGGMAYGPCGAQFREAFSCFVFSEADPKGMDCVDKFKAMQECFREHPDVYGAELEDDEEDGAAPVDGDKSDPRTTGIDAPSTPDQAPKQPSSSSLSDITAEAKDKLAQASETASAKASEVRDAVKTRVDDAAALAKEKTSGVRDAAAGAVRDARGAAAGAAERVEKETMGAVEGAKKEVEQIKDPRRSA